MKYVFEDPESPKGDNNQRALESYENSVYYDIVFPHARLQALPIVLRANIRGLYGKVDQGGFAVTPKSKYISQIETKEGTHSVLSIVRESFHEMVEYYSKLQSRNKLSPDSKAYKEMKPYKAWSDHKFSFENYRNSMLQDFLKQLETDTSDIKDYFSFEKSYLTYCLRQSKPLTMSGYVVSNNSSPFGSGLVIDLAEDAVGNDTLKYDKFIKDPNFNLFRKVVNRFGFRFDVHIPWRIYFDVNHPYSTEKMAKYGVSNLKQFFAKYYDRVADAHASDLDSFMNRAYNALYEIDSTYIQTTSCAQGTKTKIEIRERELVSLEKLNERYTPYHWLRMYIYFRSLETKSNWSQVKFEKIVRESTQLEKYRGRKSMTSHLEPYFNNKTAELFSERDLTNDKFFDRIITRFKF